MQNRMMRKKKKPFHTLKPTQKSFVSKERENAINVHWLFVEFLKFEILDKKYVYYFDNFNAKIQSEENF